MEVLGVGPLELFFILIIALIFLGPRDMVKAGRTLGKYMRQIVMSPTWRAVQQTSRDLRTLPNRLIREAGMEEDLKDLDRLSKDMADQIGSLRKPFSAAVSDVNNELKKAQTTPTPPAAQGTQTPPVTPTPPAALTPSSAVLPPTIGGLAAWTTPPPDSEPSLEAEPGTDPDAPIDNQSLPKAADSRSDLDSPSPTTDHPLPDEA